MPRYLYRAVDVDGCIIEGDREASSEAAVIEWLQESGAFPLAAATTAKARPKPGSALFRLQRNNSISRKGLTLLTRELATLLAAGLPLERALATLADLTKEDAKQALLRGVLSRLRGGSSFAEALAEEKRVIPTLYIGLVRAGEAGGALEVILERLADYLERAQALTDQLRSALLYPALLLVMTLASLIMLMTFVVPEFRALFDDSGNALPLSTRMIIGLSDLSADYGWLAILLLSGGIWLLCRKLQDQAFRRWWDGLLLRLPVFGDLMTKVEVARFSRTLATLVENGVSLLSALTIVRDTLGNLALAEAVEAAAGELRGGRGLAEPLAATGRFPDLAVQLMKVGEESGDLERMLQRLATIYDQEVQTSIDRMVALLVPVLTIGLGLIIAFVIGSVMLAFLSVNELAL